MGGIGSGARGTTPRCEQMDSIDLAALKRCGLSPGSTYSLSWRYGGTLIGSAKITRQVEADRLHIEHTAIQYDGKQAVSSADVWLVTNKQPLGGEREWFECPRCRRPCRVLYGRAGLRCRRCARLIYLSQAAPSSHARTLVGAQKIRVRLGGSGNVFEAFPCKPRTMHWKTYRKLKARHDRLTGVAYGGLAVKLDRLKSRLG